MAKEIFRTLCSIDSAPAFFNHGFIYEYSSSIFERSKEFIMRSAELEVRCKIMHTRYYICPHNI